MEKKNIKHSLLARKKLAGYNYGDNRVSSRVFCFLVSDQRDWNTTPVRLQQVVDRLLCG